MAAGCCDHGRRAGISGGSVALVERRDGVIESGLSGVVPGRNRLWLKEYRVRRMGMTCSAAGF